MTPPEPLPSDAELIRRARAGDDAAFTSLAAAWHPRIVRWACGMLDDPDDADDVAQQVLVRLYTHLSRFGGRASFSTWLYQVTRNAARDARRRRGSRLRALERLHVLERSRTESGRPDPEPGDDVVTRARAALAQLPERQRTVFDLVDLQDYAPHEAAALLGVTPATARVHLLRARRALRGLLLGGASEDRGTSP